MTAPVKQLWLVTIDEGDWDYDRFSDAAVWARSAEEAEAIARAEYRYDEEYRAKWPSSAGELWIANPEWRLHVKPAPTEGVVLVHWHAG